MFKPSERRKFEEQNPELAKQQEENGRTMTRRLILIVTVCTAGVLATCHIGEILDRVNISHSTGK